MSKKMMRRSLALGALMAFVITGSAMAAELTISSDADFAAAKENSDWYKSNKIYSVNSASGNTLTIGNVNNIDVDVYAGLAQKSSGNVNVDNNILNISGDVNTSKNIRAAYAKQTDKNATDVSITCNQQ